ncbi:S8 family serine peptidase [Clostridium sp. 19966]|uniref:S8 family serine peptidase n=1 Tax=Clostridium sp. 19966 TaxID=2768166 RepID=UPI0028DEEF16|nr:S8 family serine peptidase [Clostridium sp. 19966]MDT8718675.1 S8 family serine peptidase [Clostridium sp. 19966]
MFFLKNKISTNLKYCLENKIYKNYRVNIFCKSLINSVEKKVKSSKGVLLYSFPCINMVSAILSSNTIERLLEYPEVDYIAFDSYAFLCGTNILTANNVHLKNNSPHTGSGVGIALIDSGVYPHADLEKPRGKIKKFIDPLNNFKFPYDDNGHGTFIAGLLCGSGYSSKGIYSGVAQEAHLYAVKAFDATGKGKISDIFYAFECIIKDSSEFNIRIACLPFEILDFDIRLINCFKIFFDRLIDKNIIPVLPSGSLKADYANITGISALSNCITVGGLDSSPDHNPFAYSSKGPFGKLEKPDLSSVCTNICSLNSNIFYVSEKNGAKVYPHPLEKAYTNYTGTSCACAFISGICAILIENRPNLAFKDVLSLLKICCNQSEDDSSEKAILSVDKLFSKDY